MLTIIVGVLVVFVVLVIMGAFIEGQEEERALRERREERRERREERRDLLAEAAEERRRKAAELKAEAAGYEDRCREAEIKRTRRLIYDYAHRPEAQTPEGRRWDAECRELDDAASAHDQSAKVQLWRAFVASARVDRGD